MVKRRRTVSLDGERDEQQKIGVLATVFRASIGYSAICVINQSNVSQACCVEALAGGSTRTLGGSVPLSAASGGYPGPRGSAAPDDVGYESLVVKKRTR